MENIFNGNWGENLKALATDAGGRLLGALVAYIVGRFIVSRLLGLLDKSRAFKKLDASVQSYTKSCVRAILIILLVISIIGILGVPMTSVVAILASASVTVGLALQGSLSNMAGGIMLMVFRPFKKGDYVDAAGVSGTVTEITLFYTVITTIDNRRVTVPNGSLMNANVTNYSAEPLRRVDLNFGCGKGQSVSEIRGLMLDAMEKNEKVLSEPAPFARVSGGDNESMTFTLRAWCKTEDYWDVYFDLNEAVSESFREKGIKAPGVRIVEDK